MLAVFALTLLLASLCQGENKVIFISLDGFRHDYLDMMEKANMNISAFQEIRRRGFRAHVQNVMLTLTFPSHYAMATGRYVENHGLVANDFYDPKLHKKYHYTNADRNLEGEWFEYDHAEPLWLTNQRHNGKRTCVFQWVGSEARIRNEMGFATSGVYNGAYSLRFRIDRMLDWIQRPEFNFCMLYFNEPDHQGHKHGPNSPEVKRAIQDINEQIAYLLQRIDQSEALKGKTNLIISSDHGMAEVDPVGRIIDVYNVYKNGTYFGDSSPATLGLWEKKGKGNPNLTEMYTELSKLKHLTVYKREEIPEHYHFRNNYRIAPLYAIADIGWMIKTQERGYTNLYGMHGYNNSKPEMNPFLVAMGPDVKQIADIRKFYQIDIYPYICAMLGLNQPNKIDGKIERAIPFLAKEPTQTFLTEFNKHAYPYPPPTTTTAPTTTTTTSAPPKNGA